MPWSFVVWMTDELIRDLSGPEEPPPMSEAQEARYIDALPFTEGGEA